jgi:hypothetical protein
LGQNPFYIGKNVKIDPEKKRILSRWSETVQLNILACGKFRKAGGAL